MNYNNINYIYSGWATQHAGSLFPHQRSNLYPLKWEHGDLTTRPPGNSLQMCYTGWSLKLKNLHSFLLYSVLFHDGEHGAERVRLEQPRELRCYQSGVLRHWRAHSHRLSPGQAKCLGASMLVAGSQMWQKGWRGEDGCKKGGKRKVWKVRWTNVPNHPG